MNLILNKIAKHGFRATITCFSLLLLPKQTEITNCEVLIIANFYVLDVTAHLFKIKSLAAIDEKS